VKGINSSYRNSKLFSHDFLEEHLPNLPEWQIHEDELKRAREKLQSLFQQALPATSEPALEEEFIRPILSGVLGFSYLVQPSTKIFKTHRQPDYALFLTEEDKQAAKPFDGEKKLFENALAVADAKAWDVDLDAVGPASQMHDYILISGLRWGILTNGHRWRLTHRDTVHELDTFFEIDMEELLKADDPTSLKYFLVFFRAESFRPRGFLDHVLTQSVEYAQRVGAELKENVYDALRCLYQGFLDGNSQLSPKDLTEIHENALILLYRILFLLYAESEREQELLPLSNVDYRERIGLCALKRDVAGRRSWLAETHTLWSRLSDLFRLINRGSESLGIYAYNGGLFDPQLHPQLERWQIGDHYLAEAVKLLACTEVEGRRGFLDYSALDVRELGSIYEGLLEHKLIRKDGELVWEKDRSQRKKTGSYYTPEYIVQYIVEQTISPLIDEIQSGLKTDLAELNTKIRRSRGENRTLLEQQRDGLFKKARERVLNLKVLDPAMGSGHFLVSTCDYLARRMAELEAELAGEETEEAVQALKRTVAERCLYGVDLNPLATELAKLSLWLHTVAKGKPLSFLDHHLRTGNSLIGATVKKLKSLPSEKVGEIGLWESKLVEDIGKAIRHLTFIKESVSLSRSDIEVKKEQWELVNAWIGKYKQAANVWLSTYFRNKVKKEQYQQVLETAPSARFSQVTGKPFFQKAQEIAGEERFFHWELEFPDVFFDRFGRPLGNPGFDVVIGNPPYVRQEQIKANKPYLKKAYETYSGVADLYVYFYEQSHRILRRDGCFGMITSNKFIRAAYGERLRAFLADRATVKQIIDFGDLPVFPEVSAYPCVFVSRHRPSVRQNPLYLRVTSLAFDDLASLILAQAVELSSKALSGTSWRLVSQREDELLQKIEGQSVLLSEWLGDSQIRRGVLTGLNEAFFIDKAMCDRLIAEDPKSAELIKPLVIGEDIKRYAIEFNNRYLIFTRRGTDIEQYPAIKRHLLKFKERLVPKPASWEEETNGRWLGRKPGSYEWYEIQDTVDYYQNFEDPKIVYPVISQNNTFTLDEDGYFSNDKTFIIPKGDTFCLTLLNSSFGCFWARNELSWLRGSFLEYRAQSMNNFPIRRIAFTTPKEEREQLVEEGKQLYQNFLKTKDPAPILDFVERCLPKDDKGNFTQEEEKSDVVHDLLAFLAERMIALNKQRQKKMKIFLTWLETELEITPDAKGREGIEALTGKTKLKNYLGDYQKGEGALSFDELWEILRKNKRRIRRSLTPTFMQEVRTTYEDSLAELLPIKETLRHTDGLIDQIVYRLYGLAEEEIEVVDGDTTQRSDNA